MTNLELQAIGYWVTSMLLLAAVLWWAFRDYRRHQAPPKGAIACLALALLVFLAVATDGSWGWITG